jgi:hypothetical protein
MRTILLDPTRQTNFAGRERMHLLSGLLECGKADCDGRFKIKVTHPKGPRYFCGKCQQSVPEAETDDIVESTVRDDLDLSTWTALRRRGAQRSDTTTIEQRLRDLASRAASTDDDPQHITYDEWEIMRAGLVRDLAAASQEPLQLPDVKDPTSGA